jgi:hypothetical protein
VRLALGTLQVLASENPLDLLAVDDALAVRQANNAVTFQALIKAIESIFCPDDQPAEVPTRSKAKNVQRAHKVNIKTSEIPESFQCFARLGNHKERALSNDVSPVAPLSLSWSDSSVGHHLLHIVVRSDVFQQFHCVLRFLQGFNRVRHHKWNFRDVFQIVATCHDQGGNG